MRLRFSVRNAGATHRRFRWALSCACVVLFALAGSSVAQAAPQSYGFSDPVWGNGYIPHSTALGAFAAANAKYVRTPVNWQYYEPTQGAYSYAYLQYLYDEYTQLRANGQTPIFDVMGTPYWALTAQGKGASKGSFLCADNNNATQCMAPPDVRNATISDHWESFLATLAYIMPNATFEIWNEPNIDWFWMQPQDPQLYGLMLKTAAHGVRRGSNSTATVVSGSVNNYSGPDTTSNTSYKTFIKQMYSAAGASSFDALGFHTYPCNFVSTPSGWTTQVNADLAGVRTARNSARDPNKPLWLTETGASTGAGGDPGNCGTYFTEAQQGPALGAVLDWAKAQNAAKADLPVVLIYSLFDLAPRSALSTPNWSGQYEYGLMAYAWDWTNGVSLLAAKPALATVTCKFAGTC